MENEIANELLKLRNFGKKSLTELDDLLSEYNIELKRR